VFVVLYIAAAITAAVVVSRRGTAVRTTQLRPLAES
jgi:hypothetical protein